MLTRVTQSLRRRGLKHSVETAISIAEDRWFEFRYGTDTLESVQQANLTVLTPENQRQAKRYGMARGRAVRHVITQSGVPRSGGLVDVGAGKGRVVIEAARLGFSRVTGVEFAPSLVAIAEENIKRARRLIPPGTQVCMVCADATKYDYDASDDVFFLYNPFERDVMRAFCERLLTNVQAYPRQLWFIYSDQGSPTCVDVMQEVLSLRQAEHVRYGGFDFKVLTSR